MLNSGSQIVLATHSPILAAYPGVRLLRCDGNGVEPTSYDDSDLAIGWRNFLQAPDRYLRHLT